MTLIIEPEIGVPLSDKILRVDLKNRVKSAANTSLELAEHDLDLEPTMDDKDVASKLAMAYAADPEATSKKVTNVRAATLTPASLVLTNDILQEFGRSVVQSALQVRYLVTNKLILETESPESRTRIRALELLGKISDVGLFSEKSEVTITHQSTDDLKAKLRKKLEKLVNPIEEIEDALIIDDEPIDVDAELGVKEVDVGEYDD